MTKSQERINACKTVVGYADKPLMKWMPPLPVVSAARNIVAGKDSQADRDLFDAWIEQIRSE